jgi:hypothetical protein
MAGREARPLFSPGGKFTVTPQTLTKSLERTAFLTARCLPGVCPNGHVTKFESGAFISLIGIAPLRTVPRHGHPRTQIVRIVISLNQCGLEVSKIILSLQEKLMLKIK